MPTSKGASLYLGYAIRMPLRAAVLLLLVACSTESSKKAPPRYCFLIIDKTTGVETFRSMCKDTERDCEWLREHTINPVGSCLREEGR